MAAVAIAGGVASNSAAKVLELLAKEALQKAASWWGARDDLRKLENTIAMIQARVGDAERHREGENSDLIKLWLQRLRQVLYRAEDLFDEVVSLDLLKQQQRMEKRILGKVGILFTKSGTLCYNIKLANEIKAIRKELDDIESDMDPLKLKDLPFQELSMAPLLENRETTYVLKETVTGRENDKNNIIEMLSNPKHDEEKITVIPIVGFGGLGKTTLAQLVFNDQTVQNHFDRTAWAYVPEKDNLNIIKRKIFQAFTGENYQDKSLGYIENSIIKSIEKKKYLLVLDDLWIDEGADIAKLVSLLEGGEKGSKVIVTTRLNTVAKHFGVIQAAYELGTLSDGKSWKLFEKLAFGPGQENNKSEFSKIGRAILKMCGNVPLAIEVVGGSLKCKHTQEEWLKVKSDLSKAQSAETHNIMATLKISYDYLQPVSKLCFAYCSLFPKGYVFGKDGLVHLWMAQGYVEPQNGDQYFWDLVARNLFQVTNIFREGVRFYKMHDLLHDLAQAVAGDEKILMLGNERPDQINNRLVHVNLNGLESPPSLKNANRLRSLLNFDSKAATDDRFLLKFQSLRVLKMDLFAKDKKLLDSIGRLIHLRYLKLECYAIYLPDSITRLVNLQTLDLESCIYLKELPRDFAKLVNLKHLFLPYENLTDLPPRFGKLTSLQELYWLIMREGYDIQSLTIKFRKWCRDAIEEVKRSNLRNNHQLISLNLKLDFEKKESTPVAVGNMNEMLRYLQLPPNLKELIVWRYKGDEMPIKWLIGLSQLVSIKINGCMKCKVLPDFSCLPHLRYLELRQLYELEYIEDEDNIRVGSATQNRCFVRSLEVLSLHRCYKLRGWRRSSKDGGERRRLVFPSLLVLTVYECPRLMSLALAPKLESLDVCDINWKMVESSVRSNDDEEAASSSSAPPSSSSLTLLKKLYMRDVDDELKTLSISTSLCNPCILKINGCSQVRQLRLESPSSIREHSIQYCDRLRNITEGLHHLMRLEKVEIYECEELEMEEEEEQGPEDWKSRRGWQALSSLLELELVTMPKLKTLPRGIANLTTLQDLIIRDMEKLKVIPEEIGNLSLLRYLWIVKCPKMKSLPPSIMGLPMLHELHLEKMDNLTELPAGEISISNLSFPLLQVLRILDCPKMTSSLPSSIQGAPSLQNLIIEGCPDLGKKIMPDGQDWQLFRHIPNVYIHDGSKVYGRRRDGKEIEDC